MPKTFFVIDAFAHIYQFFYAIKGLTGPDGEPVNAVYGFARMIETIRQRYDPDYLAIAFDGPGELARHQVYEDYKANRPPMPEALQRQIPLIKEMLEAQSVPQLASPGHEADDVLAAVADRAAQQDVDTVIVTTDKDAEQLIGPRTRVLHVRKNGEEMLDAEALKELKGIQPWQVVELMALAGDSTDNVPGVPGIGPKTALALIQQFGSVRNLYEHLDEVDRESVRQKLTDHRDAVEMSARLVRLDPGVPLDFDLDRCRAGQADRARVESFYRALGFGSLIREERRPAPEARQAGLFGEEEAAPPESPDTIETVEHDYSTVTDLAALERLAKELGRQEAVAFDLETTSLEPRNARIVGFAFSWRPQQAVYVATEGPGGASVCPVDEVIRALKPLLEADRPAKLGQNLKYDMAVLRNHDVHVAGLQCDAMVASYLLDPGRKGHGLDALARRHLNYETVKIEELIGHGREQITMDQVPVRKVSPYACEDADVALQLCRMLSERLEQEDLRDLMARIEMPLVPVLADMEWVGVRVDPEQLRAISTEFAEQLGALERDIYRHAGHEFNVNSPQQLSRVLFEELGLTAPRGGRRTTGHSTASDVLEALRDEHPIADCVLRYRELSKLKSTYADALVGMVNPKTGRVHTSFNQTVTATGRLSSSDPNLQNIPVRMPLGRRIRRAFTAGADDMSLLSADYSQVELRVLAHCSADPALRRAFEEDRDIHRFVAAQVNGVPEEDVTDRMRQQAKAVNFGIIYGLSAYGLSKQIGVPVPEAERFIRSYFERYPKVREFIGKTVARARRDGFVRTLAGRRRRVEGINASGAARSAAERIAVNTVIQGTAADMIKLAMIAIHQGLPAVSERARMCIQIHDELVFEVPDSDLDAVGRFVTERMGAALDLDVPLKVSLAVGKNWADAK
jgi:DNA polymerase-1